MENNNKKYIVAWVKAIILLPINVVIFIPVLILYFTHFRYASPTVWQSILGCIILILGLTLAIWTMVLFHKIGKGTPAPWDKKEKLVVEGPYKSIRNPMLLSVMLMLLSESIILNSKILLIYTIFCFILNCFYFKFVEEKQLEKRFGEEYIEYRKNVPMWFPRIR
jgi:protein-S-isoprenylcysteine O-methyltransferase Ste14